MTKTASSDILPTGALLKRLPFAAIFLAVAVLSFHFNIFAMDEYTYLNAADSIHSGLSNLVLEGESGRFYAFPLVVSWLLAVVNDSALVAKLLNLLFYVATVWLIYKFAKKLFNEEMAYYAALLTATNPFLAFLSTRALTEPMFVFLFVLCVKLIYEMVHHPTYTRFAYFGLASAALVFTRFNGLFVFLVALAYMWHEKKLRLVASPQTLFGGFCFLLLLFSAVLMTPASSGDPVSRIASFVTAQVNVKQGALALPDKIPSYILVFPFLAVFTLPWLLKFFSKLNQPRNQNLAPSVLAVFAVVLAMEVYGMFNFRLLRYLAPIVPFLSLIVAFEMTHRPEWKKYAKAAIALNALFAVLLIAGVYLKYEKHADYANAAQFAANSPLCMGAKFSNVPAAVIHFTKTYVFYGKDVQDGTLYTLNSGIRCIVKSDFDSWTFDTQFPPSQFREIYRSGGVAVLAAKTS